MKWHSIETAPMDGTQIILKKGDRVTCGAWTTVVVTDDECTPMTYVVGENSFWATWDGGFKDDDPPTHWMPLPDPNI